MALYDLRLLICHVSSIHSGYYTAFIQSERHPNLVNPVDGRQARRARPTGPNESGNDDQAAKKTYTDTIQL